MIILSEGPHHLAVFKPTNLCVVRGPNVKGITLLDLLRKEKNKQIFPVHRLDKGTSGITLFAKSKFAQMAIQDAFKKRLVKKVYLAICEGQPQFKKLNLIKGLKKNGSIQTIDDQGDFSQTIFRFKEQINKDFCLIEAQPITGRMHQIRIHLAFLGFPIIGDKFYNKNTKTKEKILGLCAVKLSLPGPKGDMIQIDATEFFDISDFFYQNKISHPKKPLEK